LQTLAHECAHVEITARFDRSFPNVLLRRRYENNRLALRWQTILGCWDEYAACRYSSCWGEAPTAAFEDSFLNQLLITRGRVKEQIAKHLSNLDFSGVMQAAYDGYSRLLIVSAYHLGNLYGCELSLEEMPRTSAALHGHWFAPYFQRLKKCCELIADQYGKWPDESSFELLGDIVDDLVILGGVSIQGLPDGVNQVLVGALPD
jgi:hypothetical protein